MVRENKQGRIDEKSLSERDKEKTFGEKVFHFIYNDLLNFWANLIAGGGLAFLVYHYKKPLNFIREGHSLDFMKGRTLYEFYQDVVKGIRKSAIVEKNPLIKDPHVRDEVARVMGDALTVTTSGTVVVLPNIWIGAKLKEPFIQWLDKKHYGQDAEEDPHIQLRHRLLHEDKRPNLLGAIVGRAGTMLAVQGAAYTVGHKDNIFSWLGHKYDVGFAKKITGVDATAEKLGGAAGQVLADSAPALSDTFNSKLRNSHISWSENQLAADPKLKGQPYNLGFQNLGKYLSLDVLYTLVTAVSVKPILGLLQYVPFLSYREPAPYRPALRPQPRHAVRTTAPVIASAVTSQKSEDTPTTSVSQVAAESRLQQPEKTLGGAHG